MAENKALQPIIPEIIPEWMPLFTIELEPDGEPVSRTAKQGGRRRPQCVAGERSGVRLAIVHWRAFPLFIHIIRADAPPDKRDQLEENLYRGAALLERVIAGQLEARGIDSTSFLRSAQVRNRLYALCPEVAEDGWVWPGPLLENPTLEMSDRRHIEAAEADLARLWAKLDTEALTENNTEARYFGNGLVTVGNDAYRLEGSDEIAVEALVDQRAATLGELRRTSGLQDVNRILRQLQAKMPALGRHILMPGGKGKGGYRTTIRDERHG